MSSIEKLMSCLDDYKEDLKDDVYLKLCEHILAVKKDNDITDMDTRRYKRKLFQKEMMSTCLMDHITDNEYDSDDGDMELYLRFQSED
mgnify:CR=1 FL=1